MGLLELAKRNLDEYISIIETINFLAITKNTPVKYVALFCLAKDLKQIYPHMRWINII